MGIREQLQQLNEIDQFNEEEGPGWWARMFGGKKPVQPQTQNKIVYGQRGRKVGDKTLEDHLKNKPVNLGTGEEGVKNLQKEKIATKKIADNVIHNKDNPKPTVQKTTATPTKEAAKKLPPNVVKKSIRHKDDIPAQPGATDHRDEFAGAEKAAKKREDYNSFTSRSARWTGKKYDQGVELAKKGYNKGKELATGAGKHISDNKYKYGGAAAAAALGLGAYALRKRMRAKKAAEKKAAKNAKK
jgi:hypothetical protein